MIRHSVKKPFTVLVAVIFVLVIGFVSLTGMKTGGDKKLANPTGVTISKTKVSVKKGKTLQLKVPRILRKMSVKL